MQVVVTFKHMDTSDALRDYAAEKTERLSKYLSEPIEVHWFLSVEKIRHIADATVVAMGVTIKAQESTRDMYSAIDAVADKLEKQVRKHKEKVKNHKTHNTGQANVRFGSSTTVPPEAGSQRPRLVKKENQFVKPMSVEEAAMQMEVVGNDFLFFTDSTTSNINVIYRIKGGDYGLIEARTK